MLLLRLSSRSSYNMFTLVFYEEKKIRKKKLFKRIKAKFKRETFADLHGATSDREGALCVRHTVCFSTWIYPKFLKLISSSKVITHQKKKKVEET